MAQSACSINRRADLVAESVCFIKQNKNEPLGAKVLVAKTICFIERKHQTRRRWLLETCVLSTETLYRWLKASYLLSNLLTH